MRRQAEYMMKNVYIIADQMISALGFSSEEHFRELCEGRSGIRRFEQWGDLNGPVCVAAIDDNRLAEECKIHGISSNFTRLQQLFILSIAQAVADAGIDITSPETILVLASTKGNIDLIAPVNAARYTADDIHLSHTAQQIQTHFKNPHLPVLVSNACISGVMALLTGARLIEAGLYKNIVVSGADILSDFILTGFESLKALSVAPCRPFDKDRTGITLGEGVGTVVLSSAPKTQKDIRILSGSISNDANHISGPSRTGSGLRQAIHHALAAAGNPAVDYISAHGTATLYNDEMEAEAFNAEGLQEVPVNSLKGFWGHTLGAAGMLETIAASWSLQNNKLIGTAGFENHGVGLPLHIIKQTRDAELHTCLKTSSGFGGCNGVIVLQTHQDDSH